MTSISGHLGDDYVFYGSCVALLNKTDEISCMCSGFNTLKFQRTP